MVQSGAKGSEAVRVLPPPDPFELGVSKRHWEIQLCVWRKAWKRYLATAPTREVRRVTFESDSAFCEGPSRLPGSTLHAAAEAHVFRAARRDGVAWGISFELATESFVPFMLDSGMYSACHC